jgi:cysteine peptidase B
MVKWCLHDRTAAAMVLRPLVALVAMLALAHSPAGRRSMGPAGAQLDSAEGRLAFAEFKTLHSRAYPGAAEEARRYAIFLANLRQIDELNADLTDTAEYGVGKFADYLPEEMPRARAPLTRTRGPRRLDEAEGECSDPLGCHYAGQCYAGRRFPAFCNGSLPDHIDWTELGAVTPVKDQGDCGNCVSRWTTASRLYPLVCIRSV